MFFQTLSFAIETFKPVQILNLTAPIQKIVHDSELKNGLCIVSSPHTTVAVKINEECPNLQKDLELFFSEMAPPQNFYHHNQQTIDGRLNAHSHLLAFLISRQETLTVVEKKLKLGGWQSIFAIELDGPRSKRELEITLIGNK